ncbi:MAG: hypothetical protein ABIF88_03520 [archaeon]
MENEKNDIDTDIDLNSEYESLRTKYGLPEFEKMAEDFDIEKISDKESSYLAREIRRTIHEKLSAYLHLFETLINPASSPMFVFSFLKSINGNNKEKIMEIYKKLSKLQLEVLKLDTIYNEETEIKFIKKTYEEWQEIKPAVYKLIQTFENNIESNGDSKETSYFG